MKKKKGRKKGERQRLPFPPVPLHSPLCFPVAASWFVGCLSFSPLTHADWSGSQPTPFTLCRRPYFFFSSPPSFFFLSFFSLPPFHFLSPRYPFFPPPFSRHSPPPPAPFRNTSRRFFTLRDHSIGSRDIDVLTESRGDRRGGGCLWIGSFAYRPFPPRFLLPLADEGVRARQLSNQSK